LQEGVLRNADDCPYKNIKMLSRQHRFTDPLLIKKILKSGTRLHGQFAYANFVKSEKGSRFAVVVSKAVEKRSVKRNKIRRQIYEILRDLLPNLKEPIHMVIVTKPSITKATWPNIVDDLKNFLAPKLNQND
jgi:ribonuclease P protein component